MQHHVVATAGHVDHGKSTLVRALTGIEPDRWAEERRRGLTIDLGFAWTTLPSGREVAFVDVPGHERFLGNMLAGLGPAPVVCFVVAADEGWQAQSSDHRDAVAALGIRHGLLVISRVDRAPDHVDDVIAQARAELADTGLRDAPAVAVSAIDGSGLSQVRAMLDVVLSAVPDPSTTARVRLWVDRSFSITGAGTVVTGTLAAGTIAAGDRLELVGRPAREAVVRGMESRGEPRPALGPVTRAALNLRGVSADQVRRGDVLLTPGAWETTRGLDVRRVSGGVFSEAPERLTVHVGTAAVPARLRPFDDDHARLVLDRRLPLVLGDRLVLRHPGSRRVLGGAQVLDADPPALRRRGDSARRVGALTAMDTRGDVLVEVARRGVVAGEHLHRLGFATHEVPTGVRVIKGWWVHVPTYEAWQQRLRAAVQELHERDPLAAGLSRGAACDLLALPDPALLDEIGRAAGLEQAEGLIRLPGRSDDLGPAEAAVAELVDRLRDSPFHAPEADDLTALRLGVRELAAAERAGRLLRLRDGVVLLPTAPALAMRELARLDQPFTTSEARRALGTTRRVAIPLLEHLDSRGWTRRLDAGHREVAR
ncbi:selenocysteine-specific translation elongation factor [Mycobacterium sp. 852013-50091_SCH5140682]|uniref:selenocysteine-specific translation elongation factor n=1 Tax=Mycobacterium sp. 852013-50091_SCH5140682 TaxID=1834109 RepID=UPI0007EBB0D4|nr:selenocysteine-specific translation elongation factor [Mycobacterium sp. 852013-50091_SCH5140682]OBC16652.1 selenocysteine-specific translation elongation factor [Mycobacterium sp. 852013-50091_SCH5140682]